jgi:hypothetical protein
MATGSAMSIMQRGKTPVAIQSHCSSLLTLTFNTLWCSALNARPQIDRFVMMHDDIAPIAGWLDSLVAELDASGADVLSAVVPIKNNQGLSSTVVYDPALNKMKIATITECHAVGKKTFDAEDLGHPGCVILPNTGLFICKFTDPWVEKICFTMRDRNYRDDNGRWVTQCASEDWDFGMQCYRLGVKVMATTAVPLVHHGEAQYTNAEPWGTMTVNNDWANWF